MVYSDSDCQTLVDSASALYNKVDYGKRCVAPVGGNVYTGYKCNTDEMRYEEYEGSDSSCTGAAKSQEVYTWGDCTIMHPGQYVIYKGASYLSASVVGCALAALMAVEF